MRPIPELVGDSACRAKKGLLRMLLHLFGPEVTQLFEHFYTLERVISEIMLQISVAMGAGGDNEGPRPGLPSAYGLALEGRSPRTQRRAKVDSIHVWRSEDIP